MEKLIQDFVYGFISLGEFKDAAIDRLSGGEMDSEELLQYGKALKFLGEEIINDLKK